MANPPRDDDVDLRPEALTTTAENLDNLRKLVRRSGLTGPIDAQIRQQLAEAGDDLVAAVDAWAERMHADLAWLRRRPGKR